ncbi:unnamed protein product [Rhizoctonia solani]|uniref:Uncharacterized protein n=1 Tax=Rhizoctonia solani TaxID=456999 RepID=A0A8H3BQ56_9AGAM|nr:unnamed protein product [Rhizoctonia solani]
MSDRPQTAWVSRPVGGIPISEDLAPSIVFAILYALLLPNIIYTFFIRKPRAWSIVQISTVIFAVERIAWCIIRAVQAAHPEKQTSGGLMNYVQVTVALGFVGVSSEVIKLLRCVLVNTTLPENGASKDRRTARQYYRHFCFFFELAFLGATIPGIIAGGQYSSARYDQSKADSNMNLLKASASVALILQAVTVLVSLVAAFKVQEVNRGQYSSARYDQSKADSNMNLLKASASVALILQAVMVLVSLVAAFKVQEVNRMRCFELAGLTLLIMSAPIYRLCVLDIRTIDVFAPISSTDRALFYIFHLAPEWTCVSILLSTNVRARFGTGRWGDHELGETPRDKRLKKAEEDAM